MSMRELLILILVLGFLTNGSSQGADQENIYILGTFHFRQHDFEKYPQDISEEIRRAVEYKPEIICVEWINKSEKTDLYHKDYSYKIEEIIGLNKMDTCYMPIKIDSLKQIISIAPDNVRARADLAALYFVDRDYINACYQWYLIEGLLADSNEGMKTLPQNIKSYRWSLYEDPQNQKREIVEIAFPVAEALGLEKIYSIDHRTDQAEYGGHSMAFCQRFEEEHGYNPLMKMAEPVLKNYQRWLEDDNRNKTSTYYEKMNSDKGVKMLFDYYYDMFLSYSYDADYRKWHELQLEKRNWKIFELLIQSMHDSQEGRTFVLIGATHKIYLERYLEESGNFTVTRYRDLKP